MRTFGPIGTVVAVAVVMTALAGGTVVVAHERSGAPTSTTLQPQEPAARKTPDLRLAATPSTLDAGGTVSLKVRTSTRHRRVVRLQRWDPARKAWRQVAKRGVGARTTFRLRPAAGTARYRAVAPRLRHGKGRAAHVHRAARSAAVSVSVRARSTGHRPASLSADERTLLAAVASARRTYARPAVASAGDDGADACLTRYAREHSAWMAQRGRALDPGSPEHRSARRPMPAAACPGNTVWTVTRALGGSTPTAVKSAVDAWLSSPYGETSRLLTACHDAPVFEFGVAAATHGRTRWLTVLVAADTADTKSARVC